MKGWFDGCFTHIDCTKEEAIKCAKEGLPYWTEISVKQIIVKEEPKCCHCGPDFMNFVNRGII